jgi:hypothetical protein
MSAALPPTIREAVKQRNATSLQQALEALPEQEQQTVVDLLHRLLSE